jgi:uncharacterized protein
MGLFRLLFWIALIVVAIWLWRRLVKPRPDAPRNTSEAPPMVRCAHCGIHVPASEALSSEERWYCSRRHLEQGPKRP